MTASQYFLYKLRTIPTPKLYFYFYLIYSLRTLSHYKKTHLTNPHSSSSALFCSAPQKLEVEESKSRDRNEEGRLNP